MAQILTLIFASLPAGLATTLYVAFHFHDLAPYGVLDNLTAMAVVVLCRPTHAHHPGAGVIGWRCLLLNPLPVPRSITTFPIRNFNKGGRSVKLKLPLAMTVLILMIDAATSRQVRIRPQLPIII